MMNLFTEIRGKQGGNERDRNEQKENDTQLIALHQPWYDSTIRQSFEHELYKTSYSMWFIHNELSTLKRGIQNTGIRLEVCTTLANASRGLSSFNFLKPDRITSDEFA
jgi:hypothetical protein